MSSFRASCGQVAGKSFQNLISLLQLLCGIEVNELDVQLKGRAKQEICWLDIEVGHQHALAWSNSGRAFALPELLHAKAGRCSMVSDDTDYLTTFGCLTLFSSIASVCNAFRSLPGLDDTCGS